MSMGSGDASQLQRALAQSVREHWVLFLIEGIVLVVLGLLAIVIPPIATIAVTIFLGWLFLISGMVGLVAMFSIMYALEHKKELSGRWGWMLISGIIDLILAAIIWGGLPGTAEWALGLLVGINMLFGGSAMIAMALHARTADATTAPKAL